MSRILIVGASGLIGSQLVTDLRETADVIAASLNDPAHPVDISSPASISGLLAEVGTVDAIICTAGMVRFVPLAHTTDDDWAHGLANKLMGQINLVRLGVPYIRPGGCIIVTTGVLAQHPMPGSSIVTTVNAAVEAFVAAAALEVESGVRIAAVSPGWIAESMAAMGMDPSAGVPVADVAAAYVDVLRGSDTGITVTTPRRS